MATCTQCGAELKPGTKFCENCGAKVSVPQPAAQPAAVPQPPVQPTQTAPQPPQPVQTPPQPQASGGNPYAGGAPAAPQPQTNAANPYAMRPAHRRRPAQAHRFTLKTRPRLRPHRRMLPMLSRRRHPAARAATLTAM